MQIAPQVAGGVVRLVLAGELDIATSDQLDSAMADTVAVPRVATVIVDLAAVSFCDSSGISALVRGRATAAGHGITYQVVNATGAVRRILEITGVWGVLCGLLALPSSDGTTPVGSALPDHPPTH